MGRLRRSAEGPCRSRLTKNASRRNLGCMGEQGQVPAQLAGFDRDEWKALLGNAAPFAVAAGDVLFRQGDHADALYLVDGGLLEIAARIPGDDNAVISTIRPGEVVGEFALLDDGPRSARVRAVEDTHGLAISARRFRALLHDGSAWAVRLGIALRRLVASRTRATLQRIVAEGHFDPHALRQLHAGPAPVAAKAGASEMAHGLSRLRGFEAIATHGPLLDAPRGSTLVGAGEGQEGLHLVLRGAVRAAVPRGAMAEQVFVFGPGCFVGLTGHSDGGPQPLLVTAVEDAKLVHLRAETLAALENDMPQWLPLLHTAFGRQLVQDQRKANRHLGRSLSLARFNHAGEVD